MCHHPCLCSSGSLRHFVSSGRLILSSNLCPVHHFLQGIQDLLICLEMLVASVFFFYAFPLSDYLRNPHDQSSLSPTRQLQQRGVGGYHSSAEGGTGAERPLLGSKVSMTMVHVQSCLVHSPFEFPTGINGLLFWFVASWKCVKSACGVPNLGALSVVDVLHSVVCCICVSTYARRMPDETGVLCSLANALLVVSSVARLLRSRICLWSAERGVGFITLRTSTYYRLIPCAHDIVCPHPDISPDPVHEGGWQHEA